ncbi:cysteine desulfurase family protein [Camelimonas abortus]|uniref:Cysteine desulfurase n=1 Tax=Camelimonas abortus TaxID=1017184 RepID=A0ABV7LGB8_9HYPH
MTNQRVYLDYNATAPLRPAARAAMCDALDAVGNASSAHAEGRRARARIEEAREAVAALVGAAARDIVFTSGGTEAANTLLAGGLRFHDARPDRLVMLATEHPCVLEGHGFGDRASRAPVDGDGVVDLEWLRRDLARNGPAVVALQYVNSETGVIQPVAEAAALVHAAGGVLVCDAVQAAGKLPLDMATLGADALFISAHKIGGPQGVGAIVLGGGFVTLETRLLRGGGQERGARAGTENVAGLAGFGAAALAAAAERAAVAARCAALQQLLERRLRQIIPDVTIFGAGAARAPNVTAFAAHGFPAQTLLMLLDLQGIAVSSGSACSSGKVRRSHVLEAMGVEAALAGGAIRVSTGWNSEEKDIHRLAEVLAAAVARRQDAGRAGAGHASPGALSA